MTLNLSMLDEPALGAAGASGTPLMLQAPELVEDKDNPRTTFDASKLAELAEDIKARGILQPIIVRSAINGRHTILFGARRFRAGQMAGLREFPCFVATDERQFDSYAQVAENNQREGLSPMELATFINQRLKAGERKKDIASGLKVAPAAVTFLCALIDPPDFLRETYLSGKCTTPEYLYKLRNLHTKYPQLIEAHVTATAEITRNWIDDLTALVATKSSDPRPVTSPKAPSTAVPAPIGEATQAASLVPVGASSAASQADYRSANYKIVMVWVNKRSAQLLLSRRASASGRGWVKFADTGDEVEIELSTATLNLLAEA